MVKNYTIATIPGNGIGTEVMDATVQILKTLAKKIEITFEFKEYITGDE